MALADDAGCVVLASLRQSSSGGDDGTDPLACGGGVPVGDNVCAVDEHVWGALSQRSKPLCNYRPVASGPCCSRCS